MSEEKMTETEQIYDDLTGIKDEETDEQPEETDKLEEEQPEGDEELLTEEELEVERDIEAYQTKSAALDEKLAEFEALKMDELKSDKMREWGYRDDQIERYIKHIDGETVEEIATSIIEFSEEIPAPESMSFEPSLMNGRSQKPVPNTQKRLEDIGKAAYERVKHKVFPFFRGR